MFQNNHERFPCLCELAWPSLKFEVIGFAGPTHIAMMRVNQELKRSTRVASLFPNEATLLAKGGIAWNWSSTWCRLS